jgi:riboflavin biosynthesis pyrimidine reductase
MQSPDGEPLRLLFERSDLPRFDVPDELVACYGGALGFARPRLFANFVSSVDGVVALAAGPESGGVISGKNAADRFVMGLLRASADAVLIGAGTFRRSGPHVWHPDRIYPAGAAAFAALRTRLGLSPQPRLVLISASGNLDGSHPALAHDTLVVTTRAGEAELRRRAAPPSLRALVVDRNPIPLAAALEAVRAEGCATILTEGGPTLAGELVAQDVLDELFLTISPRLFGRFHGDDRKSLLDSVDLSGFPRPLELLSARQHGSFLFLRYAVGRR